MLTIIKWEVAECQKSSDIYFDNTTIEFFYLVLFDQNKQTKNVFPEGNYKIQP